MNAMEGRLSGPAAPLAIYFHGSPGGVGECELFREAARERGVRLVALDRASIGPSLQGDGYFRALAAQVDAMSGGEAVTLIGFSLGAFAALRTAPFVTAPISAIHLVSAAAPLEIGDFLGGMAGRAVFRMAADRPRPFRRLSAAQGWLAAHASGLLLSMLFGSAQGADRSLAADPAFRAQMRAILRRALGPDRAGYLRDVSSYVAPWADRLATVTAQVRIWHGTSDNWAPPEMAAGLAGAIPGASAPQMLDGASHYSCLVQAVPRIFDAMQARTDA